MKTSTTRRGTHWGKLLYAFIFLILVPVLQWTWANALDKVINLPGIHSPEAGWSFLIAGLVIMLWGMYALYRYGKGLPMNGYPPPQFVKTGPYRFLRHPIYWGYVFLGLGIFLLMDVPSGIWVVTPFTILCITALVWGYEEPDLQKRFGKQDRGVLFDPPAPVSSPVSHRKRIVTIGWLFFFQLLGNFIVLFFHRKDLYELTGQEFDWVAGQEKIIIIISLLFIWISSLFISIEAELRHWFRSVLIGLSINFYGALLMPRYLADYFPKAAGDWSYLTVPPFVIFITGWLAAKQLKKAGWFLWLFSTCLFILLVRITPSFYSNLFISLFLAIVSLNYYPIWLLIRSASERIANSWKEWMLGPVRIINHGFYAGAGAFLGMLFAGYLAGPGYAWAILIFLVVVVFAAAIWAQAIEGSDKLKRPFGYYGAVVGIAIASLILYGMGFRIWLLIGVISVAMPWVQAMGRLRCLINGCCHGAPTQNELLGIRFFHERSRVSTISHLKGKYLHPTQVYSMLWLSVIGFFLLFLWIKQVSYPFIFGMYLILTGAGRFVEEAYRGEVQTPVWNGLRLYQWAAIVTILAGMYFCILPQPMVFSPPSMDWNIFVASLLGGLFVLFAMGIDFPGANRRFSRLV